MDRTPEELDRDPMYDQAVGLLVLTGKASTSFLQRRLGLRYNAAARLMERAEDEGIVSRPNHVGKRDVLVSAAPVPPGGATPEHDLAQAISAELIRARTKFPGKNVTFAALVEEVGELATATFEESAERVRKEAIQVAVMAMRMVLDGDHCFDAWRREKGLDHLDPAKRSAQGEELSPAEDTELTRLRALIAGLDPDHWGLQARVVALKAEALREGGA